jgi:hypothetical protein
MAVQLSLDLGLHLDPEINKSTLSMYSADAGKTQTRTNLFWTVNSLDR